MVNWRDLAKEGEKEKEISTYKELEHEKGLLEEMAKTNYDKATKLNKSSSTAPEWLQNRVAYPEPQLEIVGKRHCVAS